MRGEWDLVFKSDESKGIGCAGSGIWCSDRMRARALGATAAGGTWGLPGFSKAPAAQSPRPYPKMVSPEAPSRGPGRDESMGIAQRSRTGPPPKPEIQADFPFRWSAVLENWRVAAAGPLQNSSSEHLRTGKTRFRTGGSKNLTRPHRPKANTNASSIELELVEASGVA